MAFREDFLEEVLIQLNLEDELEFLDEGGF